MHTGGKYYAIACLSAASSSGVRPHFSARPGSPPAFAVSLFTCARRSLFCVSENLPSHDVAYVCSDLSHGVSGPSPWHV